jgi:hypothetical protein
MAESTIFEIFAECTISLTGLRMQPHQRLTARTRTALALAEGTRLGSAVKIRRLILQEAEPPYNQSDDYDFRFWHFCDMPNDP